MSNLGVGNSIKLGSVSIKTTVGANLMFYRISYFTFPVTSELDLIYADYEILYNIVSSYKMQLNFVLKVGVLKVANCFLIRMFKWPCVLKGK